MDGCINTSPEITATLIICATCIIVTWMFIRKLRS